jgi:hypothetical protein
VRPLKRRLRFDGEERARLAAVCRDLGTTFEEFGRVAILHALDEYEALVRDRRLPPSPWRRLVARRDAERTGPEGPVPT